jgi:membrane protease YdiL (CAAX protease family)
VNSGNSHAIHTGAPPRRSRAIALICTLVIALIVVSGLLEPRTHESETGRSPNSSDKTPATTAYYLSSQRLRTGSTPALEERITHLISSLTRAADTPEKTLHIAIVTGELRGKREALAKLNSLSKTSPAAELAADIDLLKSAYNFGPGSLSKTEADRLVQRHGDFGVMATVFGMDDRTEPRKSVLRAALFLNIIVNRGLLVVSIIAIILSSLAVRRRHTYSPQYVPEASANNFYLEAFTGYLLLSLIFGLLANRVYFFWPWPALLMIPGLIGWAKYRGATSSSWRRALGWHKGAGWLPEISAGIRGYLAGLPFVFLALLLSYILMRVSRSSVEPSVSLEGGRYQILAVYALACGYAPLLEETMFRGALYHHLRQRWNWVVSGVVVALVFAALHPQGWFAIPALASIAFVSSMLREWRGSIIAPMTAHAFNNFMVLTLAVATL